MMYYTPPKPLDTEIQYVPIKNLTINNVQIEEYPSLTYGVESISIINPGIKSKRKVISWPGLMKL